MARLVLRYLTAVTMIVACGGAVLQGGEFVAFRWSAAGLAAAEDPLQAVAAWRDQTGLASLAIAEALRAPVDAGDLAKAHQRETLLIDYLSARPGASQSWIALAALRYSVGASAAAIASAFQMSAVTGPNEELAMTQRALFGLLQWESLSPAIRERAMVDLCGEAVANIGRLRLVLSVKSDAVQSAMRAGLRANGCRDSFLRQIGL